MNLFDVYSLFDVTPVKGKGCLIWDDAGTEYLDLYGGHAVISVGHCHPHYVEALKNQLDLIGFYSNSVRNPLQEKLASLLGELSGYDDYSLFLVNSGAEANENALKLASFHTGKDRILAFRHSFHGRTSGAVAVTDNPRIVSPFNGGHKVTFVPLGDCAAVEAELAKGDVAGVIIEGIQGVGGINIPSDAFLQELRSLCTEYGAVLILDEVQRFPRAREAIKALVKDGRYDYIETGSLISIRKNVKDIVIPSEEENMGLHPLDFEEFLWACGNRTYRLFEQDLKERRPDRKSVV